MFDEVAKLAAIKELRDTGFPLKPATMGTDAARISSYQYDGIWLYPTLEELIEACGNNLFYFDKEYEFYLQVSIGKWFAGYSDENDRLDNTPFATGSTPTEAVVRLWQALNKNKHGN